MKADARFSTPLEMTARKAFGHYNNIAMKADARFLDSARNDCAQGLWPL